MNNLLNDTIDITRAAGAAIMIVSAADRTALTVVAVLGARPDFIVPLLCPPLTAIPCRTAILGAAASVVYPE